MFVRFNTQQEKSKPVTLRALLDSEESGSLVTKNLPETANETHGSTNWSTSAGVLQTNA
jgi:hypothetical protein